MFAPDVPLVWGITIRLLSLVYVIAFWNVWREIIPLYGSRGINPAAPRLARARLDYGLVGAWLRHPSLALIDASDFTLRALPVMGALAALAAAAGIMSPFMLAIAWLMYLSLDVVVGQTFPWESLLHEAGFLAMFLPALTPLPEWTMVTAPTAWMAVAFHWLLFRVMFGFGKTKFTRDAARDPLYLRAFLISQPLPSPLGWLACRLPAPILKASLAFLFVVEMVLPFFTFVPGWPRLLAAAGFVALMIGIQLMGSFGFFNLLVIALTVSLFDPRSILDLPAADLLQPAGLVALWSLMAGLVHLPFNTWVARGWPEWPAWGAVKGPLGAIVAWMRVVMPFRTVHAYGVFPPQVGPPIKFLGVVEGSMDGARWEPFVYRYMASVATSRPKFVAPFCPRLDHFAIYDAAGVSHTNYLATIFSQGSPHELTLASPSDRLLQRLMEPDSPVRALFEHVPFDGKPPLQMRMTLYALSPTTLAERRATGHYWRREFLAPHVPPRTADGALMSVSVPSPEQWHPDERWARRRVPRMAPLLTSRGLAPVREWLDERARAQWNPFWNEIVPALSTAARSGWEEVDRVATEIEARLEVNVRADLDRVRGAVTTAILERLDPHLLKLAEPALAPASYFHASLTAHALLLEGEAAVDRALADPARLLAFAQEERDNTGLMVMTGFRRQLMRQHARKHRLMSVMLPFPMTHPDGVPGFALAMPLLGAGLPDGSERFPRLTQLADGNWLCNDRQIVCDLQ
jgi:hypothetical protein